MRAQEFGIWIGTMAMTAFCVSPFTDPSFALPPATPMTDTEIDPVSTTGGINPGINYSTGFEPEEGFALGYISASGGTPVGCGGVAFPCWGHITSTSCQGGSGPVCTPSLITPTIENINPAIGIQHLRLTHDPTTRTNVGGYGIGIDARYPYTAGVVSRPVAPNTVSVDVAISYPGGMNFRLQPQSNTQGLPASFFMFYYDGSIYILDDLCGTVGLSYQYTGAYWDITDGYQNVTIAMNPCADVINYYYADELIYSGCVFAGSNLEQLVILGDNTNESYMDVDNVVMTSLDECPHTCGNGVVEDGFEECEPGNNPSGCNPGHTCGAVGAPDACLCNRICTPDEPCTLNNGANGPFYGPFDAQFGGIFVYDAPAGVDAVSVDLCGSTGGDQFINYWGSCTDLNDPGSHNDDCCGISTCGTYGLGSDPTASCYNNVGVPNFEPCTCHNNPLVDDNCYLLRIRNPSGDGQVYIEVNNKVACFLGHLGSCCDTNAAGAGTCTDNVAEADCTGSDKIWTDQGKCADQVCECIPDCTGAVCGSDGCDGSCGTTCDDGNACNGVETCNANRTCDTGTPLVCDDGNACNGVETCVPPNGCVGGTPLSCSDGLACNGIETCNPSSGCVAGTPVNCDDGIDCTVDTCNDPDGSCSHDDADCAIPTMSQWGLVVLTIVLLVTAKVQFGRRRPA